MGENLRAALPIATLIGGLSLVAYAAYLSYVALPAEQTRRHVIVRGLLAAVGVVLVLVGSRYLS